MRDEIDQSKQGERYLCLLGLLTKPLPPIFPIVMTLTTEIVDRSTPTYEVAAAIETYQLRKVYRTGFWLNRKVESLKECTLQVYEGETFGLLGLNGAGKTTLLKTLLGIVKPTAGKGLLLGKPLGDRSIKQKIGYLPENPYFYDFLTGWELLEYTAGLFEIPYSIQKQRIPALLEMVGLAQSAAKKKQLRQYSKGMVQRVGMAQALINDPDLVFLDEPMSGLDPLGRKQMRDLIVSLGDRGKTVFFNSHVLTEVEQICSRVGILAQGELICCGTLSELLTNEDRYYYVLDAVAIEIFSVVGLIKSNIETIFGLERSTATARIYGNITIDGCRINLATTRTRLARRVFYGTDGTPRDSIEQLKSRNRE